MHQRFESQVCLHPGWSGRHCAEQQGWVLRCAYRWAYRWAFRCVSHTSVILPFDSKSWRLSTAIRYKAEVLMVQERVSPLPQFQGSHLLAIFQRAEWTDSNFFHIFFPCLRCFACDLEMLVMGNLRLEAPRQRNESLPVPRYHEISVNRESWVLCRWLGRSRWRFRHSEEFIQFYLNFAI